jgi:hypothetical protein
VRAVETALASTPRYPERLIRSAEYWTLTLEPDDSSPLNTGLRERGELMGSQGHEAVATELERLLVVLSERLSTEPGDRLVAVLDGIIMCLDENLESQSRATGG